MQSRRFHGIDAALSGGLFPSSEQGTNFLQSRTPDWSRYSFSPQGLGVRFCYPVAPSMQASTVLPFTGTAQLPHWPVGRGIAVRERGVNPVMDGMNTWRTRGPSTCTSRYMFSKCPRGPCSGSKRDYLHATPSRFPFLHGSAR